MTAGKPEAGRKPCPRWCGWEHPGHVNDPHPPKGASFFIVPDGRVNRARCANETHDFNPAPLNPAPRPVEPEYPPPDRSGRGRKPSPCPDCAAAGAYEGETAPDYCPVHMEAHPGKINVHTCAPYGRTDGRCGDCGEDMATPSGPVESPCRNCDFGFPLNGDYHYGTQRLGMIPLTPCAKVANPKPRPVERCSCDVLAKLREAGWSVAVHNDYRLGGVAHTFWLFTHPDGRWAKGEGTTDSEALHDIARRALALGGEET